MADIGFDAAGELVLRKSLKDGVFEQLLKRIVAGKYAPGEWLRQEEISSQLGVSQTPVREALDQLVSVGLAERVPYRGVRVLELTHAEIIDAYALRLILGGTAARLAAYNISTEQLEWLMRLVEQTKPLVTLDDMSTLQQLNKSFHLLIAEASGNLLLSKLYEMASNRFPDWQLYEYMFRHPELLQVSLPREYQEHKAIAEAIAAHDPELAAQAAAQHVHNLGHELVEYLGIPAELLKEKERQINTAVT